MDATKIFTVLCAFLLIICLTLAITTLTVMRNAVSESALWEGRVSELVSDLDGCLEEIRAERDQAVLAPIEPEDDTEPTKGGFYLRAVEDRLGVFGESGYFMHWTRISVETLPPSERARLAVGVYAESWEDLLVLLQDYES